MFRVVLDLYPHAAGPWFQDHCWATSVTWCVAAADIIAIDAVTRSMFTEGWSVAEVVEILELEAPDRDEEALFLRASHEGIATSVRLGLRLVLDAERTVREGDALPADLGRAVHAFCATVREQGHAWFLASRDSEDLATTTFLEQEVVPIWTTADAMAPWQDDCQPRALPLLPDLDAQLQHIQRMDELVALWLDDRLVTFHPLALRELLFGVRRLSGPSEIQ